MARRVKWSVMPTFCIIASACGVVPQEQAPEDPNAGLPTVEARRPTPTGVSSDPLLTMAVNLVSDDVACGGAGYEYTFWRDLDANGVHDESEAVVAQRILCEVGGKLVEPTAANLSGRGAYRSNLPIGYAVEDSSECANGGHSVKFWVDLNNNRVVDDDDQILGRHSVCNGKPSEEAIVVAQGLAGADGRDGRDGRSVGIEVTTENAGSSCVAGGIRMQMFSDLNSNGVREQGEEILGNPQFICNGSAGMDGADGRDGIDGAAGADGTDGVDGAAGADGADGTAGVDGAAGADGADGVDGVDGAAGADGRDGADGVDGVDGANGMDGRSVGVETLVEPAGVNCASGGLKVTAYEDANRDGMKGAYEPYLAEARYVCNGIDGAQGERGAQGYSIGFASEVEGRGVNCAAGGYHHTVWQDLDSNGRLDADEWILKDYYVCNGVSQSFLELMAVRVAAPKKTTVWIDARESFSGEAQIPASLTITEGLGANNKDNTAASLSVDGRIVCHYAPNTGVASPFKSRKVDEIQNSILYSLKSCSDGSKAGDTVYVNDGLSLNLSVADSYFKVVRIQARIRVVESLGSVLSNPTRTSASTADGVRFLGADSQTGANWISAGYGLRGYFIPSGNVLVRSGTGNRGNYPQPGAEGNEDLFDFPRGSSIEWGSGVHSWIWKSPSTASVLSANRPRGLPNIESCIWNESLLKFTVQRSEDSPQVVRFYISDHERNRQAIFSIRDAESGEIYHAFSLVASDPNWRSGKGYWLSYRVNVPVRVEVQALSGNAILQGIVWDDL